MFSRHLSLQNLRLATVEELFPAHGLEFREEQRLEGDPNRQLIEGASMASQSPATFMLKKAPASFLFE